MGRYIDAYKLEKDLPQSVPKHNVIINGNEYPVFLVDHILHKIRNYPTADVVEVVRCKDCKHATFYSCKNDACYKAIICEYKIGIGDENFYCACAEPRTPKERGGEK